MASLLTSGSMRIVVAGMFDGMVAPFLVYRGATILPSLCGRRGPVVHVGRLHVEHVADAAPAYAVRELPRDRALGGAGIGRHEGPAPPEPGEVGAEVLRRHAPERLHEGAEERVDGVDPVDGSPGAVLGVVGLVGGDLELGEDADVDAALSVATTEPAAMRPLSTSVARPLDRAPRPVTSRNVSFESFTPVMTQIRSSERPRLRTCLPRCREGRGILNDPFAWLPLNDSGK